MARRILSTVCTAVLAGLLGCGGGGGDGGGSAETATISGRLATSGTAARSAARTAAAGPVGSFYVEAVDETGATQDVDSDVTAEFRLEVPTGHDYVLIVGDDAGPIGAMLYGSPGQERAEFRVRARTRSVELGTLRVEVEQRRVRAEDDSSYERPDAPPRADYDDDGIPDFADEDDDNDGIRDKDDVRGPDDLSRDHDNDGVPDDEDLDWDDDGIDNDEDDHPRDVDNDDQDDDRELRMGGDSAAGAGIYATNRCGDCHGEDGSGTAAHPESIRRESASSIAEVLFRGKEDDADDGDDDDDDADENEFMPAYPKLVPFAADLAAFLSQDGDSTGNTGGSGGTSGGAGDGTTDGTGNTGGTTGGGEDTGGNTPPSPDGAQLFTTNCGACHTGNGLGNGGVRDLTDKDFAEISSKLGAGHNGFSATSFTDSEIQAIADALAPTP